MNRTRAMAWDVDGTLVDSEPLHLRALQSVCHAHGVDITDYGDTPFVGVAIGDVWRSLATRFESKFKQQKDNAEGEFRRAVTRYYLEHSREVRVLPGARQALEHLSSLGISLAAVSNSERPIVLANLRTIGVLDLFQVVVSLDDVGKPKPAAEPYLRALATMAVPAREAWAVEDSVSGARSARAAGLRVLIVGEDELAQGDQRLNDLRDFQQWWTSSGLQSCTAQREFTQLTTDRRKRMTSIVVVTGGASGIGAAICTELASRGYAVVVTDKDEAGAETIASGLPGAHARKLDVTLASTCHEVVTSIESDIGPIEAWVSNAGVSRMARFLDIDEKQYDFTLDVNLKGLFFSGQAAARVMAKRKSGCIVNIASMAGKQGRAPFLADYVASKFGAIGLTQAMAFELAPLGIRVNAVCPGFVATSMQVRELEWESSLRGTDPESVKRQWIADTPMGRLEQPQDVARVVAFLLSNDAGFVTGESIAVNGGAFMD